MSFDYEYVDEDSVHPELRCAICVRPLHDAVEDHCAPLSHSFCSHCITQWLAGKRGPAGDGTCPTSRVPLTVAELKPAGLARRLTNELKVYCSLRSSGCPWTGRRDNLMDHLANSCNFELLPCPGADVGLGPAVPGCTAALKRADLESHATTCPFVLMKPMFGAVAHEMSVLQSRARKLQHRVVALEDIIDDLSLSRKKRTGNSNSFSSATQGELLELDGNGAPRKTIIHVNARLLGDDSVTLSFALAKTTRLGKLMESFTVKVHEVSRQVVVPS